MRSHLSKILVRNLLYLALFAVALLTVRALVIPAMQFSPADDAPRPVEAAASTATDSPAFLVAKHDCWTGEAPADMADKVPGHVVVTVDGRTRYAGTRMVGKALKQVFEDVDHGLTVNAFCR